MVTTSLYVWDFKTGNIDGVKLCEKFFILTWLILKNAPLHRLRFINILKLFLSTFIMMILYTFDVIVSEVMSCISALLVLDLTGNQLLWFYHRLFVGGTVLIGIVTVVTIEWLLAICMVVVVKGAIIGVVAGYWHLFVLLILLIIIENS